MWTVQPFHLPIIRKKYTFMRTPIRCGAAAGSGSFTTVSAIGSRGHIAVPKGQHGRGVLALLSTTIDNVGLSSSFTYTPRAPLSLLAISWHLGGLAWLYFPTKSGTGGLRCSPFTHKSYGVFWVLDAAPTRYGQPASPCVTIMLGSGWSVMFITEEPALLDPPAVSADGGQLFL